MREEQYRAQHSEGEGRALDGYERAILMTRLNWDRVRRERSLYAKPADLREDANRSLWRGVGPPLTEPMFPGVVRWAVTLDGSQFAVQWRA